MIIEEENDYTQTDENVRRLVTVLNKFDGLHTNSSCGGRADADGTIPHKRPAGAWYVNFTAERTRKGWDALTQVTDAILPYIFAEKIYIAHFPYTKISVQLSSKKGFELEI